MRNKFNKVLSAETHPILYSAWHQQQAAATDTSGSSPNPPNDVSVNDSSQANEKGGNCMDWQEKYFDRIDKDIAEIKSEIRNAESRLAANIDVRLEQFRNEMRHLDNQRNQDMAEIRSQMAENTRHVQNMTQATVIGVSSMVIAVVLGIAGIWWTVSTSQNAILEVLQKIPK